VTVGASDAAMAITVEAPVAKVMTEAGNVILELCKIVVGEDSGYTNTLGKCQRLCRLLADGILMRIRHARLPSSER
jgi:hypothetical protein